MLNKLGNNNARRTVLASAIHGSPSSPGMALWPLEPKSGRRCLPPIVPASLIAFMILASPHILPPSVSIYIGKNLTKGGSVLLGGSLSAHQDVFRANACNGNSLNSCSPKSGAVLSLRE